MKTATRFKKGDMVKNINPNTRYYDEVAKILLFDEFTNKYLLEFNNGYKCEMFHYDIVKNLNGDEQRKLYKEHLLQLADIALSLKDKEWFENITKQLKGFKE